LELTWNNSVVLLQGFIVEKIEPLRTETEKIMNFYLKLFSEGKTLAIFNAVIGK
jgi:hypothetical protein